MDFKEIATRAIEIRTKYAVLEKQKYGREWTRENIVEGFVGDVGDLVKLTMAKQGIRDATDVDEKLAHELADCLWSICVVAHYYDIDLEKSFLDTMNLLEGRIKSEIH